MAAEVRAVDQIRGDGLKALARLRREQLAELHAQGTCPSLTMLTGVGDGLVLTVPVMRGLRLWRGKVFDRSDEGAVTGLNRLGIAGYEKRRYPFQARIAESAFSDRQVLLLDHDRWENPVYIRRFHDEVVQMDGDTLLATSHYNVAGKLRLLAYFAIQLRGDVEMLAK